jgi:hypothetical protein
LPLSGLVGLYDLLGSIRRAIGGDEDLQPVAGIGELQGVLQLLADALFLIVGSDDQRDVRRHVRLRHRTSAQERQCAQRERIACVRISDQRDR